MHSFPQNFDIFLLKSFPVGFFFSSSDLRACLTSTEAAMMTGLEKRDEDRTQVMKTG